MNKPIEDEFYSNLENVLDSIDIERDQGYHDKVVDDAGIDDDELLTAYNDYVCNGVLNG